MRRCAEGSEGSEGTDAAEGTAAEAEAEAGEAERRVLHGVDLSLHRGQRLLLLGDNGAGKSTLLLAALGRLPLAAGTAALAPDLSTFYFAQDAPEQLQAPPSSRPAALHPACSPVHPACSAVHPACSPVHTACDPVSGAALRHCP